LLLKQDLPSYPLRLLLRRQILIFENPFVLWPKFSIPNREELVKVEPCEKPAKQPSSHGGSHRVIQVYQIWAFKEIPSGAKEQVILIQIEMKDSGAVDLRYGTPHDLKEIDSIRGTDSIKYLAQRLRRFNVLHANQKSRSVWGFAQGGESNSCSQNLSFSYRPRSAGVSLPGPRA
jgi:hypothetical protein